MRALLTALVVCVAATAFATTYEVPSQDGTIREISQAMDLASAGDTVQVFPGVYDSVRNYLTPVGVKTAIVKVKDGVTLVGTNRRTVIIDHRSAEYGILCLDVGQSTLIRNLTVRGGAGRDSGRTDDGDGRNLTAGLVCMDGASPTIQDMTISASATGILVRSDGAPSAPTIEGVVVARGSHHGIYVYENGESAVIINRTTVVDNFDVGIYVFGGEAAITNACVTHNGKSGINAYLSSPVIAYCNVFWNDVTGTPPQDYEGIEDQTGQNGNIAVDPYYCDFTGSSGYDYHVCTTSPMIAAGQGGVTIGAYGGACQDCVSLVREASWGSIKALYR
jgi:hypothetical protein